MSLKILRGTFTQTAVDTDTEVQTSTTLSDDTGKVLKVMRVDFELPAPFVSALPSTTDLSIRMFLANGPIVGLGGISEKTCVCAQGFAIRATAASAVDIELPIFFVWEPPVGVDVLLFNEVVYIGISTLSTGIANILRWRIYAETAEVSQLEKIQLKAQV